MGWKGRQGDWGEPKRALGANLAARSLSWNRDSFYLQAAQAWVGGRIRCQVIHLSSLLYILYRLRILYSATH